MDTLGLEPHFVKNDIQDEEMLPENDRFSEKRQLRILTKLKNMEILVRNDQEPTFGSKKTRSDRIFNTLQS